MSEKLSVTLIQADIYWENIGLNLSHFERCIDRVAKTDIIFLPEMFNTGFTSRAELYAEEMNGKTISWMKKVSDLKKCSVVGTLLVSENNNIYNRLVWVKKNGNIKTYDKRHLFSLAGEDKIIDKGKNRLIIEDFGWKICPLICYDLRFPVFSRNNEDYDMLVYLANWPVQRIYSWNTLLRARAIENQCYVVGLNRVGVDANKIEYSGDSLVLDVFGKKIASLGQKKNYFITLDLEKKQIHHCRKKINFLKDMDDFYLKD